jgi:PAS domain S-box-containing protein
MGLLVYYKSPTGLINKVFFFLALELAVWQFTKFNLQVSENYDFAFIWQKIGFAWILMVPTMFIFAVVYAGKEKILKNKILQVAIWAPMFWNLYSYITTDESGLPHKQPWGWAYDIPQEVYEKDFYDVVISIWMAFVAFSVIFFFFYGFFKSKGKVKRQQAKFILVGILILLAFGLFDWSPGFRMNWPELFGIGLMIFIVLLGYAVWKYELFAIDPVTASESIIKTMDDALFLVDSKWEILSVNQAACELTGDKKSDLEGENLRNVLFGEDAYKKEEFTFKVLGKDIVRDYEILVRRKGGKVIPVSISTSKILGNDKLIRGIVCLGRDITARKDAMQRLKQQTNETKRINNLLKGREVKLKELRETYNALKTNEV